MFADVKTCRLRGTEDAGGQAPMATWPSALIFDVLSKCQIGGNAMVRLPFYAIAFGLAASLLAVPTGLLDWTGIKKEKPAWKIGLYHMALNLVAILLFAINLGSRWSTFHDATKVAATPLLLSAIGTVLLIGSAYLGGVPFAALARAGRVEELKDGALMRADMLFRWDRHPWCPEIF